MLWLAVHLPCLPLDLVGEPARGTTPFALVESSASSRQIACANPAAQALGVQSGMSLAAAVALAGEFETAARDEAGEQAALERLAIHALGYSAEVALLPPATLVLEIAASARLFGGLKALINGIEADLLAQGYALQLAAAPTPSAAAALARSNLRRLLRSTEASNAALAALPLDAFDWPEDVEDALGGLGLRRFGDLLQLPRGGLARRFGPDFIDQLDRLCGRQPDPLALYAAPEQFSARLELSWGVEHHDGLWFPLKRLLRDLGAWLIARQRALIRFSIVLIHERHGHQRQGHEQHADSERILGLLAPSADLDHLFALTRTELERLQLPAAVIAIKLSVLESTALAPPNRDLFGSAAERGEDVARLIERLRSRLGENALYRLIEVADHRPERATARSTPMADPADAALLRENTDTYQCMEPSPDTWPDPDAVDSGGNRSFEQYAANRPLFLIAPPRPLASWPGAHWRGATLEGPERIESGWWDDAPIARDYFRLITRDGQRLWVFRERGTAEAWFVQGLFA